MAKTLEQNINQAISDFASIKDKIVEKGVDVPAGTPTRDYAAKVDGVYEAGAQEICDVVNPKIVEETERLNNHVSGTAYDRAFEAGKKSEYDAFWDAYQDYGKRGDYQYAFDNASGVWTAQILRPKYNINTKPGYGVTNMFWYCAIPDLTTHFENLGIAINTHKTQYFVNMFAFSVSSRIFAIDASNAIAMERTFYESGVVTIDKIIANENATWLLSFYKCFNLTSVVFEGYIGNNIDLSYSPLNKASLTSVVNALSTTTTGLTVTLRLSAVNTAFETSPGAADGSTSDEWLALAATKPNWTISLINS